MADLELDHILIKGAREHNLKGVDVVLPKKKLVVLTGVSGSGKSSLAFDTLYAEGQRRYVESLSAYARQFLGRMEKPRYDTIRGLSPAVSIEQKTTNTNPRSTVGTITEIADYLRLLYARVGEQHCYRCGSAVSAQTPERIAKTLLASPKGTRILILASLLVNRKGEHKELLAEARQAGYVRLRVDGEVVESANLEALEKKKKHDVEAVVDRIVVGPGQESRVVGSVEQALAMGKGTLIAAFPDGDRPFSEKMACPKCSISFPELTPAGFSFNSPQGMCPGCNGLGTRMTIDPARLVPDDSKSIDEGAVAPWGPDASKKIGWAHDFRGQLLRAIQIPFDKPWKKFTPKQRQTLFYGTGEKRYKVKWKSASGSGTLDVTWEGIVHRMMRRFTQTQSDRAKRWYAQFMGDAVCETCQGMRLRPESAAVRVGGMTLVELSELTVDNASRFFDELRLTGASAEIAAEVLKEIKSRLGFLRAVGLGYLSLLRSGPTLSGGESQRIRLASQVGSDLTGVIYILDEPSIGLHQRDNQRLLDTLVRLRDIGNTVVVVEHDEHTIRAADHVIDFGPGAGVDGGHVVFAGSPAELERSSRSLTGAYLSGKKQVEVPARRREPSGNLRLEGVTRNNLKDVSVDFPLGVLTCVTGVSGAGKSTLVADVLHPVLKARFGEGDAPRNVKLTLSKKDAIDKVIDIDQKPIGRTPRSNPATYIKVFDEIRSFFAELPEARMNGYTPGRFCSTRRADGARRARAMACVRSRCTFSLTCS